MCSEQIYHKIALLLYIALCHSLQPFSLAVRGRSNNAEAMYHHYKDSLVKPFLSVSSAPLHQSPPIQCGPILMHT